MALHRDFPESPHVVLDPAIRWFPADEALRESSFEKLLPPLVPELRKRVKEWRDKGYAGATETSRSLLNWWFNIPHLIPQSDGTMAEFQYYFAQREAVETIVYLYDVVGVKDKYDLMRFDSSGAVSTGMFDETWRRFVVKMATGTGKTKVMSLVLAWSYFHKLYEPESELARNFLVITPNIIVLDRIYRDFNGLRIFFEDPVLPDNGVDGHNWRDDFQPTLHLQDDVRITRSTGNIFLTNIHRVYAGDDIPPSPDDENTMDYFLGKRPTGATTDSKVDLGMIVRDIEELVVLNDEAHHIHDSRLAWFKSIEDIHNRLKQKDKFLSLQVDVTATPKHNNGAIFVQTVSDYPLVEAISQNVVKHPVLPDAPSRAKLTERKSAKYTEKYSDYIHLGVVEWRKAYAEHEKLGKKAILFVMTDDTKNVTTIVGLRAYSAKSNILPEQTLGRGLRKMYPSEVEEYVSVVGTNAFMEFVESIRAEGVVLEQKPMGEGTKPKTPLVVEIDKENAKKDIDMLDIEIPVMTPRVYREYKNLSDLDVSVFGNNKVAYRQFSEEEQREIVFKDITTGEVTHTTMLDTAGVADYRSAIGYFAQTIMKDLRLVMGYDVLYGKVKEFVQSRLFDRQVELEDPNTLRNLSELVATKTLIETFKKAINALTIQDKGNAEIRDTIKLRHTRPFVAKDQGYLIPKKSVFNKIDRKSVV